MKVGRGFSPKMGLYAYLLLVMSGCQKIISTPGVPP